MRCAEVEVIEVQDQLKLIIVECAELLKAFLDLLHSVHVLSRGCIVRNRAGIQSLVGRDERAFICSFLCMRVHSDVLSIHRPISSRSCMLR